MFSTVIQKQCDGGNFPPSPLPPPLPPAAALVHTPPRLQTWRKIIKWGRVAGTEWMVWDTVYAAAFSPVNTHSDYWLTSLFCCCLLPLHDQRERKKREKYIVWPFHKKDLFNENMEYANVTALFRSREYEDTVFCKPWCFLLQIQFLKLILTLLLFKCQILRKRYLGVSKYVCPNLLYLLYLSMVFYYIQWYGVFSSTHKYILSGLYL